MPSRNIVRKGRMGILDDIDALAFIIAADITDNVQKRALHTLVIELKAANLWSKLLAIYPFVGGTASTHKWNLKDPRDLNAAFRLTFTGGWIHSSTGAKPNGTTAYATTFFIPVSNFIGENGHMSYYSRTNSATDTSTTIGCDSGTSYFRLSTRRVGDSGFFLLGNATTGVGSFTSTDSRGFYLANASVSDGRILYKNGSSFSVANAAFGNSILVISAITLGSNNNSGGATEFDDKECAFSTLGHSLNATDNANMYNIIQKFQTILGRQV